jgi:hypothetical protein
MSDKKSFVVGIFLPRWGHEDTYQFNVSLEQLSFTGGGKEAACKWVENREPKWSGYNDTIGNPLEKMLEDDSVYTPTVFIKAIEHAWMAWREGILDDAQLETEVEMLCEWLNAITIAKPTTAFWRRFF